MNQRDLRNRIRSAQGHLGAIAQMIETDASFVDILRQLLAVRGALRAIHRELWRAYLLDRNCGLRARDRGRREREWHQVGLWLTKHRCRP